MNQKNIDLCKQIIDPNYISISSNALKSREKLLEILLSQRRLPDSPWDDLQVKFVLDSFAAMDSNNFVGNIGAGEREGRIFSKIVQERNFGLGHGIGRSGDVAAVQPKAAGSSLICKLTKYLVKDALKLSGYLHVKDLILLPLATGMSLTLCFLVLKQERPKSKFVILSRIDQKTCLKCITSAGLEAKVLELVLQEGSYLECDYKKVEETIEELGKENVCCIMGITSCFSPRCPDSIQKLSKISESSGIPLVVNNAYGIQCPSIANSIENGILRGKVDFVVQSMDKNFMVPVGGAIVFSPDKERIKAISNLYPGRASAAPIVDLFITLLQMGKDGYLQLLQRRQRCFEKMKKALSAFSLKNHLYLIPNPKNSISLAVSLDPPTSLSNLSLYSQEEEEEKQDSTTQSTISFTNSSELGGMLYNAGISGARVVGNDKKKICGIEFQNYGSHSQNYPFLPYITLAAAIGIEEEEIDGMISRLEENLRRYRGKKTKLFVSPSK